MMQRFFSLCMLLAAMLAMATPSARAQDEATTPTQATKENPAVAQVKLTTTLGEIVLELDPVKAPATVDNFLTYVTEGYFKGTIFHRVIPGFMIQAGGFTPEMDKKDQGLHAPVKNEWENGLKNVTGTIAMARMSGNPDSATSQFFINEADNASLDQPQSDGAGYCVFGKVVKGMDTVEKIRDTPLERHPKYPAGKVTPITPVIIEDAQITNGFDPALLKSQLKALAEAQRKAKEEAQRKAMEEANKQLTDAIAAIETAAGHKMTKTASGLMYVVNREGTGDKSPAPTNKVTVHYRGTLVNGTQFDSSYDRGEPTTFGLNQVIKGWTEGLGLMKEGQKNTLVIPPELAYGSRRMGSGPDSIPPNSWLIFEVELIKIN